MLSIFSASGGNVGRYESSAQTITRISDVAAMMKSVVSSLSAATAPAVGSWVSIFREPSVEPGILVRARPFVKLRTSCATLDFCRETPIFVDFHSGLGQRLT